MIEPDFNRDRWNGQMNPSERELLYRLVMREKPDVVVEVGTCRGGGTTFFIASALRNNGKGKLYTCENNSEFYETARKLYRENPDYAGLEKYVEFYFGGSRDIFAGNQGSGATLLGILGNVDICMLDGPEDGPQTVYDFAMFRPFIKVGGYVLFHDWDCGKCGLIRPFLQGDQDWELIQVEINLALFHRVSDVHGRNP
jgi:predicted O-methyltransferase YrrM